MLHDETIFQEKYKTIYHDTVMQIKIYLPRSMQILLVKGNQDKHGKSKLILQARLNIKVNKLIVTHYNKNIEFQTTFS